MGDLLFERELETLLNQHSQENASNTPDFILAQYLLACLRAWNTGVQQRETWYGATADRRPQRNTMKADTFPDRLARYLAWHLPRRLVYWSSVRLFAHATGGPWSRVVESPAVTVVDALARWERGTGRVIEGGSILDPFRPTPWTTMDDEKKGPPTHE